MKEVFEIDFDGHILCKITVTENGIIVDAAINGYGNSVPVENITVTELK